VAGSSAESVGKPRRPRADALRNRERVLVAAREAFAREGPTVSLDDIARRANVGPGTVHRHFPSKDTLFAAVIADRLEKLAAEARTQVDASDPGSAFSAFFRRLVAEAGENLALSAALSDPATTIQALREAGNGLEIALNVLLTRAQNAGAIRTDLTAAKLHAIIAGVLTMEQRLPAESLGYGLTLVIDGLKPNSP
jgi:AcrR family transcriptional regulator